MSAELPARIRVKISSESVAEIAMTPVVSQEMTLRELVEVLLGVCGRDAARIAELLGRGSVVEGASRFRWEPLAAGEGAVAELVAGFPVSDPSRRFDAGMCHGVRLCGPRARIELTRELAAARRMFKTRSFWAVLMAAAEAGASYAEYSYRERADVYRMAAPAALAEWAGLLKYSGLASQLERAAVTHVELLVRR